MCDIHRHIDLYIPWSKSVWGGKWLKKKMQLGVNHNREIMKYFNRMMIPCRKVILEDWLEPLYNRRFLNISHDFASNGGKVVSSSLGVMSRFSGFLRKSFYPKNYRITGLISIKSLFFFRIKEYICYLFRI